MNLTRAQIEELTEVMNEMGADEIYISESGKIYYSIPGKGLVDGKGNPIIGEVR